MITQERLRQVIRYEPETGDFFWIKTGVVAGGVGGPGYWQIGVDRTRYYAHRLAWLWMTGAWPQSFVDHADGDKTNNRWSNLRLSTVSQNCANAAIKSLNKSGFKGVSRNAASNKWQAHIKVKYRSIYLGLFDTPESAHAAYVAAAETHFNEFARAK